jgi:hypothetical protein
MRLTLHVNLDAGREVAAARHIWAETRTELRPILAALAAELCCLAESAAAGATRVLVVSEKEAEAALAAMAKAPLVE